MIYYKKYQNANAKSSTFKKWYGRSVSNLVEFDEFIEHMANHHCAFGESAIRGVLVEMESCLRELLLDGKAVRLGGLGIFKLGLKTAPSDSAKEFTSENIQRVRMNLFLGKRFRAAGLYSDAKFSEATSILWTSLTRTTPKRLPFRKTCRALGNVNY